ncbi:MAG: hypothetical protein HY868_23300 [Chloroflexi bacterium]|nr:hypothetical protein [Chloroflexota bacterium]
MAGISTQLRTKLQSDPEAIVHLIVRVKDDPQAHVADVQARGLTVQRTFSLIPAMAVEGKAGASLALADQTWVLSVEEDKPVHTM